MSVRGKHAKALDLKQILHSQLIAMQHGNNVGAWQISQGLENQ